MKPALLRGLCLTTAILLAGCNVGPKYHPPAVPVPASWRVSTDTGDSLANLPWWQTYQDPTLLSLIRTALNGNLDLRIAVANIAAAQAQVGVARSHEFPLVSAGPTVERQRFPSSGAFPSFAGSGGAFTFNSFSFAGNVSYMVDFWGRYRQATEQSRQNLLATEEARRVVVMTVVSDVAQAYFQLLMLDRELAITRQTAEAYAASLKLTQDRYQFGVVSELDVRQAETALESAQADIPALERQIVQQENALSILLGHNPEAVPRGRSLTAEPVPAAVPAGLPSELLTRRPDIRQAADQLAAAYAGIGVAKAQLFPQLQLTASGGLESAQLSQLATVPSLTYNLISGLVQPLFTGGMLRSNLKLAEAQQQSALINYQRVALEAFREVNDALASFHKDREQAAAQERLAASSRAALDLANVRYRGGVDTYLTVLDAQRQLFTAELSLAQTRGAILTSFVQLYQALGGGWTEQP